MARELQYRIALQYTVPGSEIPETGADFTDTLYFQVTDEDDVAALKQMIARAVGGLSQAKINAEMTRRLKQHRDAIKAAQDAEPPPPPPELTTEQVMAALAQMLAPAVAEAIAATPPPE